MDADMQDSGKLGQRMGRGGKGVGRRGPRAQAGETITAPPCCCVLSSVHGAGLRGFHVNRDIGHICKGEVFFLFSSSCPTARLARLLCGQMRILNNMGVDEYNTNDPSPASGKQCSL